MASSSTAAIATTSTRSVRIERSPESSDSHADRNNAATVLQSFEKLSWHSFSRRESLQQTRLHFQNVVAGFTDADEASLVKLPMDNTPKQQDDRRRKASSSKGKDRSNVGGPDDSASPSSGSPGGKVKDRTTASPRGGESSTKKKRKSAGRS